MLRRVLHTTYVTEKLASVNAVQTLSRLKPEFKKQMLKWLTKSLYEGIRRDLGVMRYVPRLTP